MPPPIEEANCDFNLKDALERSPTSVLCEGELDGEKLIDIEEVDELTLVEKEIEKASLEDKAYKSFKEIVL